MTINKLFKQIDLSSKSKKSKEFETLLENNINSYAFSVVWTNGLICNLNFLFGNVPPSTIWHPIISKPITDNDGEISVLLGSFASGRNIQISFGIQAVEAIPKLTILVTNTTTGIVLKRPEGNEYKKLAKGDFWQTSISITLP